MPKNHKKTQQKMRVAKTSHMPKTSRVEGRAASNVAQAPTIFEALEQRPDGATVRWLVAVTGRCRSTVREVLNRGIGCGRITRSLYPSDGDASDAWRYFLVPNWAEIDVRKARANSKQPISFSELAAQVARLSSEVTQLREQLMSDKFNL